MKQNVVKAIRICFRPAGGFICTGIASYDATRHGVIVTCDKCLHDEVWENCSEPKPDTTFHYVQMRSEVDKPLP